MEVGMLWACGSLYLYKQQAPLSCRKMKWFGWLYALMLRFENCDTMGSPFTWPVEGRGQWIGTVHLMGHAMDGAWFRNSTNWKILAMTYLRLFVFFFLFVPSVWREVWIF